MPRDAVGLAVLLPRSGGARAAGAGLHCRWPPATRSAPTSCPLSGRRRAGCSSPRPCAATSRSCSSRVNGRPLVWLDNAATTQKPQSVIDRISRFYAAGELEHPPRGARAGRPRDRRLRGGPREGASASSTPARVKDIIFVRGTTEGVNLVAQSWGRRHIGKDDEIVLTWLEHHSNIVPWQLLAAEKGAKIRVAPIDDDGQILLDEYEKLLNPRTRLVSLTHVSNALGTVTPAGRDDRDGAPPRRARAGGRRAGRVAHARGRAGARLRLLRLLGPQDVRARPASASSTASPRCSSRRRPGRAAAT